MKLVLIVIGFILLVILLGIVSAKFNNVELGTPLEEMSKDSLAKYLALRPLFLPAELFLKLFRKVKR